MKMILSIITILFAFSAQAGVSVVADGAKVKCDSDRWLGVKGFNIVDATSRVESNEVVIDITFTNSMCTLENGGAKWITAPIAPGSTLVATTPKYIWGIDMYLPDLDQNRVLNVATFRIPLDGEFFSSGKQRRLASGKTVQRQFNLFYGNAKHAGAHDKRDFELSPGFYWAKLKLTPQTSGQIQSSIELSSN